MINFTVGPVQSSDAVRAIGAEQVPYFRTAEFSEMMLENERLVKKFANATKDSKVVFMTCSGSGGMEAAIINCLTPQDKALVINGGSFGERFVELLTLHKIPFTEIKLKYGRALKPEHLAEYESKGYTTFLMQKHETSTGVHYDINLVSDFCKRNNCFLIVDTISTFLCDSFDMAAMDAGVMITGSQKALACAPGIAVMILAPSAIMPAASASPKSSPVPAVQSVASTATPQSSAPINTSGVEMKEMDRVRRIIADHMVMSKKVSPHVTNVLEVDVTKLVRWREKNKDVFFRHEGVKLTYMPMITEAVAKALVTYPQLNVSVDGYNILFKKHINIGIAVSLNDGNLIVPVVHDADHLNLNGLAVAIDSLALKARDNKLMPDDIDGGTFTITNFGTFKSLFGTPVINQPQVAILGVGYIEKKPAVIETPEGDTIAIRHKMYLSLSYDHQVVDGMLGGNFLHFIADYLENWKG